MKIKWELFLLLLFLSIGPLILLSIANVKSYDDRMTKVLKNDLESATSTQKQAIDSFFEERDINISAISEMPTIQELLDISNEQDYQSHTKQRKAADEMLKGRVDRYYFLESITIIDRNFKVVTCSEYSPPGEMSVLKNLPNLKADKNIRFSNVFRNTANDDQKRVIAAVKGIFKDDEFMGYAVEEFNMEFFNRIRLSAGNFNNGTVYLLDGAMNMLTAGDKNTELDHYVLSDKEKSDFTAIWKKELTEGKELGFIEYEALENHYLSYFTVLENSDWSLIASVNTDEVLQTKDNYKTLGVTVIIVMGILLLAVNYMISSKIAGPIEHMIQKFQQIQKSQDYSIRMDRIHNNEMGQVAKEINILLDQIQTNIHEEREAKELLKEKVIRDPFTLLYHKEQMRVIVSQALEEGRKEKKKIALGFLDIDDFKDFNSLYGHLGGDKVLRFVCKSIKELTDEPAGRMGGDEFAILLKEEENIAEIEIFADKLIKKLNAGIDMGEYGKNIPIQCSMGIIVSGNCTESYDELIELSDQAMYTVKEKGKNNYFVIRT